MYFIAVLGLSVLHLPWTTHAAAVQATLFSDTNCGGNAYTIEIDVSTEYCFGIAGNSFNNLQYDSGSVSQANLYTFSESVCGGSSAQFSAPHSDCMNIPFGGAKLTATYRGPLQNATESTGSTESTDSTE
jgi:hypothetical protein